MVWYIILEIIERSTKIIIRKITIEGARVQENDIRGIIPLYIIL